MSGILGKTPNLNSGTLSKFDIKLDRLGSYDNTPYPYDSGFTSLTTFQPLPWGVSGVTTQRGHYHRIGTIVWYDCTCHCETHADETKMWFEIPFRITDDLSYQPWVGVSHASDAGGTQDYGNNAADHVYGQMPHYYDYVVKFNSGGSATGWSSSGSRTFYWSVCYEAFWPLSLNTGGQSMDGGTTVGFTSPQTWAMGVHATV
tara:strand:- start:401 stop:1006 length:606 start_codon:yes stop_codon:yes gene_type:complete